MIIAQLAFVMRRTGWSGWIMRRQARRRGTEHAVIATAPVAVLGLLMAASLAGSHAERWGGEHPDDQGAAIVFRQASEALAEYRVANPRMIALLRSYSAQPAAQPSREVSRTLAGLSKVRQLCLRAISMKPGVWESAMNHNGELIGEQCVEFLIEELRIVLVADAAARIENKQWDQAVADIAALIALTKSANSRISQSQVISHRMVPSIERLIDTALMYRDASPEVVPVLKELVERLDAVDPICARAAIVRDLTAESAHLDRIADGADVSLRMVVGADGQFPASPKIREMRKSYLAVTRELVSLFEETEGAAPEQKWSVSAATQRIQRLNPTLSPHLTARLSDVVTTLEGAAKLRTLRAKWREQIGGPVDDGCLHLRRGLALWIRDAYGVAPSQTPEQAGSTRVAATPSTETISHLNDAMRSLSCSTQCLQFWAPEGRKVGFRVPGHVAAMADLGSALARSSLTPPAGPEELDTRVLRLELAIWLATKLREEGGIAASLGSLRVLHEVRQTLANHREVDADELRRIEAHLVPHDPSGVIRASETSSAESAATVLTTKIKDNLLAVFSKSAGATTATPDPESEWLRIRLADASGEGAWSLVGDWVSYAWLLPFTDEELARVRTEAPLSPGSDPTDWVDLIHSRLSDRIKQLQTAKAVFSNTDAEP